MYAAISLGGTLDGVKLLSPEAVTRAGTVRTRSRDIVIGWPMRWRLGYHMAATSRGVRPDGFGHFGLGGSGAWADPELGLSVAMVCNRMAGTPFGDQRMLKIGAAAVKSARAR
jgi:CubicO group peptidase (beta-lactamase class C family)